jgi:hypothetical protein
MTAVYAPIKREELRKFQNVFVRMLPLAMHALSTMYQAADPEFIAENSQDAIDEACEGHREHSTDCLKSMYEFVELARKDLPDPELTLFFDKFTEALTYLRDWMEEAWLVYNEKRVVDVSSDEITAKANKLVDLAEQADAALPGE